jgi:hypothetical protein
MLLVCDSTNRGFAAPDRHRLAPERMEVSRRLAEQTGYVIGVDTHRDRHSAAILTGTGALVVESSESADRRSYKTLLAWARRFANGRRVWAVEGSGSYGAGLTSFLGEQGEQVVEIGRRVRRDGGVRAKSDPLDAIEAAREALARPRQAAPGISGEREALRVLVSTREGAVLARTAAINQLRALIVAAAPKPLRASLCAGSPTPSSSRVAHGSGQALETRQRAPARSHYAPPPDGSRRSPSRRASSATRSRSSSRRSHRRCSPSPASARSAPPVSSSPGRTRDASAPKPASRCSPAPARSPPPPAKPSATGSTAAATANSTEHSTHSRSPIARPATNRAANARRRKHSRDQPLPKALPRPPPLPPARALNSHLTA